MKTYTTTSITTEIRNQIENLLQICREYENIKCNIFLEEDMNFYENIPCYYYTLENNKLIGILSVFIPDEFSCEIYACTHPDHRQAGVFSNLLITATETLSQTNINNIQIVCEPNSSGENWLLSNDYNQCICECLMKYNSNHTIKSHCNFIVKHNEDYTFFELSLNSESLGKCNIAYNNNCATIYDVQIYEEYQGNGYSKILIDMIIPFIKKSSIVLHVTSSNIKALRAYISCGFDIIEELRFYDINQ